MKHTHNIFYKYANAKFGLFPLVVVIVSFKPFQSLIISYSNDSFDLCVCIQFFLVKFLHGFRTHVDILIIINNKIIDILIKSNEMCVDTKTLLISFSISYECRQTFNGNRTFTTFESTIFELCCITFSLLSVPIYPNRLCPNSYSDGRFLWYFISYVLYVFGHIVYVPVFVFIVLFQ